MNLNKFTKAELISKFKKLEHKNDSNNNNKNTIINQIKTYLSQILELLLTFKTILLKLTLISFFIKIFTKYRIFRRFWWILNTIVMFIFGISLADNFGTEFISNFFKEIKIIISNTVDYLTNTSFYTYLHKLFSKVETNENKSKTSLTDNQSMTSKVTNNENKSMKERTPIWVENSLKEKPGKISDWFKAEVKETEIIEPETNHNKYYIIAGMLIVSALAWYYFPEIKASGISVIEWIKSFGGGDDPTPPTSEARANLDRIVKEKTKETELKISDLMDKSKGKNVRIISPSLENLNEEAENSWNKSISPTSSTSSSDTIKADSNLCKKKK